MDFRTWILELAGAGRRAGFVIGAGVGARAGGVTFGDFAEGVDREVDTLDVAVALRIGAGFTDRLSLYLAMHYAALDDAGVSYTTGLAGIGAAWHLRADGGTPYLHGAFGATIFAPSAEDEDRFTDEDVAGSGALVGLGYAFASRFSLEFNATALSAEEGFLGRTTFELTGAEALLRYDWYRRGGVGGTPGKADPSPPRQARAKDCQYCPPNPRS